ncbi:hypothetical protein [Novosphingobium sp.]|uniref:hypothetical protein n=1 Tax=Novosphingobium sp. TaxID=1874826 RepID=UPI0025E1814E|nr:hypothetical protein [Novosphingobium sp.]
MESWFLFAGMALCLFSLWAIGRRDWVRLRGLTRSVDAEVIGHRITRDSDGTSHAAVYRFTAEGAAHEVTDQVLHTSPRPPLGTRVTLHYPFGRPELARVPRPLMWLGVYALLAALFALLLAKTIGLLPD